MADDSRKESAPDEPDVLGAAPTIEFRRETRAERAERKRAERAAREAQSSASPIAAPPPTQTRPRAAPTAPPPSAVVPDPVPAPAVPAGSGVEYVFEPRHARSMRLGEFPAEFVGYARDIWQRRLFVKELARADIRRRHANTALGALWSILEPLFQVAIYFMLFTIIRRGSRPIEFLPVLVWGIFCFQLVTSALNEGGTSIQRAQGLMLNSTFPRGLLPVATVYKGFLRFIPTIGVMAVVHVAVGAPLHWGLLLMPFLFSVQLVLSVGLALCMSTITVYFRDVQNAMSYIARILFFTTPIIYPLRLLPAGLVAVLKWQPLFGLFAAYQQIVGGGTPSVTYVVLAVAWSVVLLLVGAYLFMRHERDFANLL